MKNHLLKLRCYLIVIAIILTVIACSVIVAGGSVHTEEKSGIILGE